MNTDQSTQGSPFLSQVSRKTKWGVVLLATVGLLAGMSACRHGGGFHSDDPEDREKMFNRMAAYVLDDIDASEDQQAAIQPILETMRVKFEKHRDNHQGTKEEFKELLTKDQVDKEALHQLIDTKSQSMTQLGHEMADAVVEIHALLTPEQRAQLAEKAENHQGRKGCHH